MARRPRRYYHSPPRWTGAYHDANFKRLCHAATAAATAQHERTSITGGGRKCLRKRLWECGVTDQALPGMVYAFFQTHPGYNRKAEVEAAFREPPDPSVDTTSPPDAVTTIQTAHTLISDQTSPNIPITTQGATEEVPHAVEEESLPPDDSDDSDFVPDSVDDSGGSLLSSPDEADIELASSGQAAAPSRPLALVDESRSLCTQIQLPEGWFSFESLYEPRYAASGRLEIGVNWSPSYVDAGYVNPVIMRQLLRDRRNSRANEGTSQSRQ